MPDVPAKIVGLVRDAYYDHSRELPPSTVYIPLGALSNGTLEVRPAGGLLRLVSVLRDAVNGCDRNYHRAFKELQRLPVQSEHCRRSPQPRTSHLSQPPPNRPRNPLQPQKIPRNCTSFLKAFSEASGPLATSPEYPVARRRPDSKPSRNPKKPMAEIP